MNCMQINSFEYNTPCNSKLIIMIIIKVPHSPRKKGFPVGGTHLFQCSFIPGEEVLVERTEIPKMSNVIVNSACPILTLTACVVILHSPLPLLSHVYSECVLRSVRSNDGILTKCRHTRNRRTRQMISIFNNDHIASLVIETVKFLTKNK